MILLDRRTGSAELFTPLQRRKVPVELTSLDFADAAIVAFAEDEPVTIGVERKRINDLINSIQDGRLSGHQLPGLLKTYTYPWILVEGRYRVNKQTGQIEMPRGKGVWQPVGMTGVGLDRYLLTLAFRGGCQIWHTSDIEQTGQFLEALWGWWTQKAWSQHRSHLALHHAPDTALFTRPSLAHRMAAELDGVGFERAEAIARVLPRAVDLTAADEDTWQTIPGIGKKLAARIHRALRSPT